MDRENVLNWYADLLNVEPSNLVPLRSNNAEFDNITITFTDESSRRLEIEDKVNITFLINKQRWHVIL